MKKTLPPFLDDPRSVNLLRAILSGTDKLK